MKVRDIMTTDVPVIHPDTRVAEVARIVLERGLPGLPVVDGTGKVLGLVTHTDLVAKHARVHVPRYVGILGGILPIGTHETEEDLRHVLGVTASDLMQKDPPNVAPDADIDDAASVMVDEHADPILVLDGGRLAGVLTQGDIIRLLLIEESDDGERGSD